MLASLESWETITDIVSNAFTVAAIGIGAVWAYWRFLRERTRWPRAVLELVVTHRKLDPQRTLLNVTVKVHNAGVGLMRVTGLRVDVYRVLPLDAKRRALLESGDLKPNGHERAQWPCIDHARRA